MLDIDLAKSLETNFWQFYRQGLQYQNDIIRLERFQKKNHNAVYDFKKCLNGSIHSYNMTMSGGSEIKEPSLKKDKYERCAKPFLKEADSLKIERDRIKAEIPLRKVADRKRENSENPWIFEKWNVGYAFGTS